MAIHVPPLGALRHVCLSVGLPDEVGHICMGHAMEFRSRSATVECFIIRQADHTWWLVAAALDLYHPDTIAQAGKNDASVPWAPNKTRLRTICILYAAAAKSHIHSVASLVPYLSQFLSGLWLTMLLSFVGIFGGFALGVFCAVVSTLPGLVPRLLVRCYVELMRNTPLLVQIFVIFFALPSLGLRLSP